MEHVGLELREPDARNLDFPHRGREFRLYVAITNKCNRACPFCSMHSSPAGSRFISLGQIMAHVPPEGRFQVQLEGGEPYLHPLLDGFTDAFNQIERCTKIIITTNGSMFPFVVERGTINIHESRRSLTSFFSRYPGKMLFKVSLNYHLLDSDPLLFEKAALVRDVTRYIGLETVFNARKRTSGDEWIERLIDDHDLRGCTNSFYLQRYGRNSGDLQAGIPYIVGINWNGINPDGTAWGTDLVARSDAMRRLS